MKQFRFSLVLTIFCRAPEVDTSDASTQTDDSVISSNGRGRPVLLGIICMALAAVFIYNFLVEVEYTVYI